MFCCFLALSSDGAESGASSSNIAQHLKFIKECRAKCGFDEENNENAQDGAQGDDGKSHYYTLSVLIIVTTSFYFLW